MNSTAKKILDIIRSSKLATGVDISKYNKSGDFDIAEYEHALEVLDFVMVRASSGCGNGTIYIDPLLDEFYAELVQHPHIIRDVYHYFSSNSPWQLQYDYFIRAIDGKDFEILTLDFESAFNNKSREFAKGAYDFMAQLRSDFPSKRIAIYTNKYIYQGWAQAYYDFGSFLYHHAQYTWNKWYDVNLVALFASLSDLFSGGISPNLPVSRMPDGYFVWQVASQTGIGHELGFGADYLDVNVSKLPLEDFRQWSGLYNRWNPDGEVPSPPDPPVIENPPLTKLYYPCEEKWRVTQYFGERPHIYTTSRGHNGIDFGIPVGNPIYCAWDGVVEVAREDKNGYGRHLRIRHSHGLTIYGHLSRMDVTAGDKVTAKQVIGLSGGDPSDPYSGYSTGPHLHFEYRWDIPAPQVPGGFYYNAVDVLPILISHTNEPVIMRAEIIVGALNIRSGAGVSHSVLYYAPMGTTFNVYEEKSGWLRLGTTRWCSGGSPYVKRIPMVDPPEPPAPPEPPEPTDSLKMVVSVDALNVRTGPSTDYPKIGTMSAGTVVEVQDVAGKDAWAKIDETHWCAVKVGETEFLKKV